LPRFDPNKNKRAPANGAKRTGPANASKRVSVTISVRRRDGATQPAPKPDGTFLGREEFAAKYGASPDDLATVVTFGSRYGLVEVEKDRSIGGRIVVLSGTVQQVSEAFGVPLYEYEKDGERYRGHEQLINLPPDLPDLMDIVEGVYGLDNRKIARTHATPAIVRSPLPNPGQVAKLYNFPDADGTGQTIGLIEFDNPYTGSDIEEFFKGQPPQIVSVNIGGPGGPYSTGNLEVTLDILVAGSVAPRAKIVVYYAPWTEAGWVQAVTQAIHDTANAPSVISISWGYPEFQASGDLAWTEAAMGKLSELFREAAPLGVTIFASTGDQGSSCAVSGGKAHVFYPASDPSVTACGGTMFQDGIGPNEVVWNDGHGGATGGGVSKHFGLAPWQEGIGVPAPATKEGGRGIPDVAGYAAGYSIVCQGRPARVPGTSGVAPLWAGLVALLNQKLDHRVGFLNPYLYNEINKAGALNDVREGNNDDGHCAPFYHAAPGWDACTGLGTPDGTKILAALTSSPGSAAS